MLHGPATPQITRDPRLKEGWRAAAAAYRLAYGVPSNLNHGHHHEAMTAAIAAFKRSVPDISDREAMLESIAAVSYASQVHPDWLYALYKPAPRKRD
jgi:hypothetical protein